MTKEIALAPDDASLAGIHGGASGEPALGRDPFAEVVEIDPFLERLDGMRTLGRAAGLATRAGTRAQPVRWACASRARRGRKRPASGRPSRCRGGAARARPRSPRSSCPSRAAGSTACSARTSAGVLATLAHLVEGEMPFDRFGFSPDTTRRAFPFFHALYRGYFRVRSQGHEHLPEEGAAVLAANHGGPAARSTARWA